MADIDSDGNVINNEPTYTARMKSNATDIRRTIAPTPTVVGTFNINTTAAGFTSAAKHLKDTNSFPLNSGILFRVVDSTSKSGFIGLTQASLSTTDCFLVEEGDEVFVPAENLDFIQLNSDGGITFSCLGE